MSWPKPGERVRVLDLDPLLETLDANGCLDGLLFAPEMERFCGREFRVLKQVRRIVDYYGGGERVLEDTYFLDGVRCEGSIPYPRCDRGCFYFWRRAWLCRTDDC
jgi:hypothetical protein